MQCLFTSLALCALIQIDSKFKCSWYGQHISVLYYVYTRRLYFVVENSTIITQAQNISSTKSPVCLSSGGKLCWEEFILGGLCAGRFCPGGIMGWLSISRVLKGPSEVTKITYLITTVAHNHRSVDDNFDWNLCKGWIPYSYNITPKTKKK